MGYSHYWSRPPELPTAAFNAAANDCRTALLQTNIVLAGPRGWGSPVFTDRQIAFNGAGRQGCETFCILGRDDRSRGDFCKTNRQPYDLWVQIALIICSHHFGTAFLVSSDGGNADWDAARRFCIQHLGYGGDFQLTKR